MIISNICNVSFLYANEQCFIQQSACLSFLLLVINATQLREQTREVVCIVFAEFTALQKYVLLGQLERVNINLEYNALYEYKHWGRQM